MTDFETLSHDQQLAILLEVAAAAMGHYDLPAGVGVRNDPGADPGDGNPGARGIAPVRRSEGNPA